MKKHKLIRNINKGVAIIVAGTILFTSCNNMLYKRKFLLYNFCFNV